MISYMNFIEICAFSLILYLYKKKDYITRIHPQGKVAPRMFLELARPKSDWIGLGSGGGVPVLISSIPKTIGFFIFNSISALNYN